MNANREKTSNTLGIVVSVLLHGIFFAGCLALDATSISTPTSTDGVEINQVDHVSTIQDSGHKEAARVKS